MRLVVLSPLQPCTGNADALAIAWAALLQPALAMHVLAAPSGHESKIACAAVIALPNQCPLASCCSIRRTGSVLEGDAHRGVEVLQRSGRQLRVAHAAVAGHATAGDTGRLHFLRALLRQLHERVRDAHLGAGAGHVHCNLVFHLQRTTRAS